MANMEKIIRPHLPANIAPADTTAKTADPPNVVAKFPQSTPAQDNWPASAFLNPWDTSPFPTAIPEASFKTKKSSISYYAKYYMKKREKETSKE